MRVFESVENKERTEVIKEVIRNGSPSQSYFLMVIFSVSMASLGILLDSMVVLIGSMLLAPVLYPVLGIGMGLAVSDFRLTIWSAYTLIQSMAIALIFAVLVGLAFTKPTADLSLVRAMSDTESLFMYLLVSLIAGLAASFSLAKTEMSESFSGIAVAVSLVPPLALAGLAGTELAYDLTVQMALLFGSNVAGVIAGSALIFLLMRFETKRRTVDKVIKEEEKEIEEENQ